MELNGIAQSLDNKSILVTGSTGFLSKIFVEKLLRVQPNLKQLFLLLRRGDASSPTQRLQNDVTGKEVFRVLRKKHGVGFDSFISEKVTPVFGDVGLVNLGIKDSALNKKMQKEVDFVANFAATTNFDERYDVALDVNTMGAKHVLDFSEKCENLEMILHISTAYINTGGIPGVILEEPFDICQIMKENSKFLDIEEERRLAQERLNELKAAQVSKDQETTAMKELGHQRAKLYGCPNTYTLTKAMGEMIINRSKRSVPVVIARPTIVSSTYKDPFPGWIEGVKTFDPIVISVGNGKIPCFLGRRGLLLDIIPGDMVVNAVIVAMMKHMKSKTTSLHSDDENGNDQYIYHIGSSAHEDPTNIVKVLEFAYDYFSENPLMRKDGNVVKTVNPVFLPTLASYRQHIYNNYVVHRKEREIFVANRFVDLYAPFLELESTFDDSATEKLRMSMKANGSEEADMFDFDPKCIDWKDYFINTHIPGLMKYAIQGFKSKK